MYWIDTTPQIHKVIDAFCRPRPPNPRKLAKVKALNFVVDIIEGNVYFLPPSCGQACHSLALNSSKAAAVENFFLDEFVIHDIGALCVCFVCVCRPDGWLSVVGLRLPPLLSLGSQWHLHLHWWAALVLDRPTYPRLSMLRLLNFRTIAHRYVKFAPQRPHSRLSLSLFAMPGHMSDLLLVERDLVTSLKDYIRAEEDKLERIKRWGSVASWVCGQIETEAHSSQTMKQGPHVLHTITPVTVCGVSLCVVCRQNSAHCGVLCAGGPTGWTSCQRRPPGTPRVSLDTQLMPSNWSRDSIQSGWSLRTWFSQTCQMVHTHRLTHAYTQKILKPPTHELTELPCLFDGCF